MMARELHAQLQSAMPPQLLHGLPPEVFPASRIPCPLNACIYETAPLDHIKALGLDVSAPIVVYGAGEGSLDAETAAEKLRAARFTHVPPFNGGLASWIAAGLPLEGTGQLPQPAVPDGRYRIDTAQSVIRGPAATSSTITTAPCGSPTVNCSCARDNSRAPASLSTWPALPVKPRRFCLNAQLLAHPRSDDFFDVAHHPTAQFVATAAEKIDLFTDGTPNHLLRDTFTLRGISRPLESPVRLGTRPHGLRQHLRLRQTRPLPRRPPRQRPHPSSYQNPRGA